MEERKHALCSTCRIVPTKHSTGDCERCRSRKAIAVLVDAVSAAMWRSHLDRDAQREEHLSGLEAIGLLMEDRGAERKRHRREMFEEQREAQRNARDAYSDGREVGNREAGGWD